MRQVGLLRGTPAPISALYYRGVVHVSRFATFTHSATLLFVAVETLLLRAQQGLYRLVGQFISCRD